MHPLPVTPVIGNLDSLAIDLHSCGAGPGQRIQHRMQLRADRIGESAVQLPHAIAALPQLHMPPVLLQLIIDRLRTIGVGSVDYPGGQQPQILRAT